MTAGAPRQKDELEGWALVEIYKAAAETADRVSDRRQAANVFYFTLVSAAFTGFFASYGAPSIPEMARPVVCGFGLVVCVVWFVAILSFRRHNSAKFKAIRELEQRLPFAFFTEEHRHMSRQRLRMRFTTLELVLPVISAATFAVLLLQRGAAA